jgi:hypothetical protein
MSRRILLITVLCLTLTAIGRADAPAVVGICPFYDDTATPAGERSGIMLPVLFLEKAGAAGFLPVIINPGPVAVTGSDAQFAAELGRDAGADLVLVGQVRTLATASGKKPTAETLREALGKYDEVVNPSASGKKPTAETLRGHVLLSSRAANLVLTAKLLETATGREIASLDTSELVKTSWFGEVAHRFTLVGAAFHRESFWFAETNLGKAIGRSAEKLIATISQHIPEVKPSGAYAAAPPGRTCPISIRVSYKARKLSSKIYSIAVNGKEESLAVKEGILHVEVPSGPILLHISVQDPPYRQLLQSTYYANSMVSCSGAERTLVFEIGSAGEALTRWQ